MKKVVLLFVGVLGAIWAFTRMPVLSSREANAFSCSNEVAKLVVEKSNKVMKIYDTSGCVMKTYTVRTGLNRGPKQCEGDKRTPEGTYHIVEKRNSKYVKFLELDYPQAKDIARANELGCNPGNAIGIHYYNKEYTDDPSTLDGSLGCVTVWDKDEIQEINRLVKVGTKVEITL